MNLVLPYLKYLRDISRKLILRSGYEKVLPGTKGNPDCFCAADSKLDRAWFTKVNEESNRSDRKLFLGIGLVTGTISTANNKSKKLAAPIIIANVIVDFSERQLIVDTSTMTLNYDLITQLTGVIAPDEEDAETSNTPEIDNFQRLLLFMDDFENKLNTLKVTTNYRLNDTHTDDELFVSAFLTDFLKELKRIYPKINLSLSDQPFNIQVLKEAIKDRSVSVFLKEFFFCAKYPDQLSTFIALNNLINQLQGSAIENPLLEKLVVGALHPTGEHPFQVFQENVREAIKFLPLTLSDNQKQAIYNAWENEVSYIQGPPGTGKSHTIAAIMLTALFLKKKVLLISQKKAAINVVRDKIAQLSGDPNAVIFITTDTVTKQGLRNHLETISHSSAQDRHHGKLNEAQRFALSQKHRVNETREQLWAHRQEIKRMIDLQRDYYIENKEFIQKRDYFSKTFNHGHFDFHEIESNHKNRIYAHIEQLKEIYTRIEKQRKDVIYIKSTFNHARRLMGAEIEQFTPRTSQFELYLSQLLDCSVSYTTTEEKHRLTLAADAINAYRKTYDNDLDKLIGQQKQLIAATIEEKWRNEFDSREKRDNINLFRTMLYNTDPKKIQEKMDQVDYKQLTDAFPLWAGLIRDLGSYLRFDPQLFDLVIVDESSQVNIAESLPAFYRGKRICVVGDRKQLGLDSAGLFMINRQFEQMVWNQYFVTPHTFQYADQQGLIVSKHSILEFLTNPNNHIQPAKETLNEHYRSMPKLALFTSNTFYQDEGGLKIMTMVGENVTKQCFQPVKVDGSRDQTSKIVAAEIDMFKKILSELIDQESWKTSPLLKDHFIKDFNEKGKRPSIGILSFTTDQNIAIKTFLEDVPAEKRNEYNIFAGTTEEFQGNERNIMFILPALDSTLVSTSFYNNPLRFNVATSRAINFTYLIYGGIPNNFTKFQSYLRHFNVAGVDTADRLTFMDKYYSWKFDESKLESEFEERVYPFLIDVLQSNYPSKRMAIFNQAESCGKRLDFVIFNIETSKAFAIEVDGHTHFEEDSLSYTEDHIEREALLKRAGWDILHIPYYRWYNHGWLSDKNYPLFLKFTETLRQDLKRKIDNIMN